MVGLGRMGMNMTRRLLRGEHQVVAYNRTWAKTAEVVEEGAVGAQSLQELSQRLAPPRVVWMMLPAGDTTDQHARALAELLSPGDLLIDGGNTYFEDDIRRARELEPRGIHYLDAGVSGGIWGLQVGYCIMIGGEEADFRRLEPLLRTLAPPEGYLYCGPVGAGHFLKMVHNGIEYALTEAYGEGFDLLHASPYREHLDLRKVAHLWNQGSVVRSWLLELLESALAEDPDLSSVKGYVEDSGEGRWTVQQAVASGVSAPVIAQALFKRFQSRQEDVFSDRVIAALRHAFGGHKAFTPPRSGAGEAGQES
jgi:6-phosphogluconate dehydrogenase